MKKFVLSCVGFAVILTLIIIHSISMKNMGKDIKELSRKAENCVYDEDWQKAELYIEEIQKRWDKKSIWTALTIKTDEIEQIEISLKQSKKYLKLQDKGKFIGEFTMFSALIEHIPHQEGFRIEEIL